MVLNNLIKILLEQIHQTAAKRNLEGQTINRELYSKPPKKAGTDKLWKLLITVYGLCDALKAWYLIINNVLEKSGMLKSKFDDAIFHWLLNGKLEEVLCCHVDDLSGRLYQL